MSNSRLVPSPGRACDREQEAGGFDDFLSKVVSLRAFINYSSYIFNILNCCFLKDYPEAGKQT